MTMQRHLSNPYWVNSIDELFKPETKWIGTMDDRDCDTGILAFAYPENEYGYIAYTQITTQQAAVLREMLLEHGFELSGVDSDISFMYKIPGAKWWTEFPENLVSVKA